MLRYNNRPAYLVCLDEIRQRRSCAVEVVEEDAEQGMEASRERDDDESESEECAQVDELFEDAVGVQRTGGTHRQRTTPSFRAVLNLKGIVGSTLLLTPRN